MKHSYIFAYGQKLGSYTEIRTFLDKSNIIETWRHELPNIFFIVSEESAEEISDRIRRRFKNRDLTHLVMEYTDNSQGWLSNRSWHMLDEKEKLPKSEEA